MQDESYGLELMSHQVKEEDWKDPSQPTKPKLKASFKNWKPCPPKKTENSNSLCILIDKNEKQVARESAKLVILRIKKGALLKSHIFAAQLNIFALEFTSEEIKSASFIWVWGN